MFTFADTSKVVVSFLVTRAWFGDFRISTMDSYGTLTEFIAGEGRMKMDCKVAIDKDLCI